MFVFSVTFIGGSLVEVKSKFLFKRSVFFVVVFFLLQH